MGGGITTGITVLPSGKPISLDDNVYYVTHAAKGIGFKRWGFTTYTMIELPRTVADQVQEVDRKLANTIYLWQLLHDEDITMSGDQGGWLVDAAHNSTRGDYYSNFCKRRELLVPFGPAVYVIAKGAPLELNGVVEKNIVANPMSLEDVANLKSASRRELRKVVTGTLKI